MKVKILIAALLFMVSVYRLPAQKYVPQVLKKAFKARQGIRASKWETEKGL
ncbi:MAG: hypothetical protein PW786_02295 [Arachidicoccus sp.]|nr:hypothetical protein [Arachidicoccus sp.]